MFPFLGPEMIEWFLDQCARPKDKLNRSLMDRLISGLDTDNEAIGTQRGTTARSTDKMEDYDE